jgi:hypothetical protein
MFQRRGQAGSNFLIAWTRSRADCEALAAFRVRGIDIFVYGSRSFPRLTQMPREQVGYMTSKREVRSISTSTPNVLSSPELHAYQCVLAFG